MKGTVFSIEEFSIYDGPGIRTTVFFKGCPLRCSWCHNPEGQRAQPEIIKSPNGCIHCGACEKNAVEANGRLSFTLKSISACPGNLLRMCGEVMSAEDLAKRLMKNQMLLRNGGVTFSGGEPLLQGAFLKECLFLLKGEIHTAVQTSGYGEEALFSEVLALADYVLFDLKLMDEKEHIRYTGVSNQKILNNFRLLVQSGKEFVVRIPLIPGVTDTEENIAQIAAFLKKKHIAYAELLSYNKMAGGKYAMVGRQYTPQFDEGRDVMLRKEIFAQNGIQIQLLK